MSKPKRLTRAESAARTRRQLLDAAAAVFAKHGYGGASVQRIADAAGRTTGALYAHFASKEDLFLELLRERLANKVTALSAIEGLPTDRSRADALGSRFGNLHEIEGDWDLLATEFWLYAVRNPRTRKALSAFYDETRREIAQLLEADLRRRGRAATVPIEHLAGVVIAIGDGLGHARRIDTVPLPASLFPRAVGAIIEALSAPVRTRSGGRASRSAT